MRRKDGENGDHIDGGLKKVVTLQSFLRENLGVSKICCTFARA